MTKEEQEAIMYLKQCVIRKIPIPEEGISWLIIALNFIDKLQKENEELKEMLKNRIRYTNELEQDLFENASNYVVSKDKIRDKIKELEEELSNEMFENEVRAKIEILQELLE